MSERGNNGKTNLADKLKELMKRPVEQLLLLMLAIQHLIGLLIGLPEIDVTSTIHEDKLSDYLGKVAKGINSRVRVDRTDEEKKEIKKAAQDAILLNKVYFQTFLDGQVGLAKEVLYAVTGKENIEISSMKTEVDLSRVGDGKDAVMDMVCKDSNRALYDTEAQIKTKDAPMGRAVRYQDILGSVALGKGQEDSEMPEVWIIFICRYDVLNEGKLLYHDESAYDPAKKLYLQHIVYVNCAYNKEKASPENKNTGLPLKQEKLLLELIHDFCEGDPNKMIHDSFKKRAFELHQRDERGWTKLEEEFDRYVAMKNEEVRKQTREETEILTRTATREEDEKEFAARTNAAVGLMRNCGLKDDDIRRIKDALLNSNQTGRVAN